MAHAYKCDVCSEFFDNETRDIKYSISTYGNIFIKFDTYINPNGHANRGEPCNICDKCLKKAFESFCKKD